MKTLLLSILLLASTALSQERRFGWIGDDGQKRVMMMAPAQWPITEPAAKSDLTRGMPRVLNQGMIGSCHDDKTEVLTASGWKLFSQVSSSDLLGTVDPESHNLIFEKPIRLIALPYSGDLICMENRTVNFRVTPEHRMLVRKWDASKRELSDKYSFIEAKDLGWYFGLMNRIKWDGIESSPDFVLQGVPHKLKEQRTSKTISTSDWMRFLGLYLAEGTMYPKNWCEETSQYRIQLAAFKNREKEFAKSMLDAMALTYSEESDRLYIRNKRLYYNLHSLGLEGVKAPQKFVPESVFAYPSNQIGEFLTGHFMGDGSEQNGHRSHYTSSALLAEGLQRAIFLSGNESFISTRPPRSSIMNDGRAVIGKHDEHRVSVCERKGLSVERKNMFKTPYNGIVYCAEVPTYNTLVTRREGKILISGNCVAHGTASAWSYAHNLAGDGQFDIARLMTYYEARKTEGTTSWDSGCQIVDAVNWLQRGGSCKESLWPYDTSKFRIKPPATAYAEGKKHSVLSARKIDNTDERSIRLALTNGYPVVVGFLVYPGIYKITPTNYVLEMPKKGQRPIGGHCTIIIGHDDSKRLYRVRNSWGSDWGNHGDLLIPYEYIHSGRISEDTWVVVTVATP